MGTDINTLLQDRKKTHGEYRDQAPIVECIIESLRSSPNWVTLPDTHRVAIYLIALKLGRIGTGNFNEPDHWADIAGYAKLVENEIVADKPVHAKQ